MTVTVLGVGGFDNEGLPFNSFLVDRNLLVECPPDILVSLGREGMDPSLIRTVFLSHVHGDHVFGIPFLLFRLWKLEPQGEGPDIVGPSGVEARVLELCALAISPDHPYLPWVREACRFVTVKAGEGSSLGPYYADFAASFHAVETLGFTLSASGKALLAYLPDTRWDDSLKARLAAGPEAAFCDVNGSGGFTEVHMSLDQVERGFAAVLPPSSRVLGTHLSRPLPTPLGRVGTAWPGLRLELGADPRAQAIAELVAYGAGLGPDDPQAAILAAFLRFARDHEDALERSCREGHLTASAFVVDPSLSRVLLVHHAKLGLWLQPGGHCEKGERLLDAALREVGEETGLWAIPIAGAGIFDLDIHEFPARGQVPAHLHYDLRWLFQAQPGTERPSEESHAVEWLGLEEAVARNPEASIARPLAKLSRLARQAAIPRAQGGPA
jgi:8-oxo-dGTP pyrophosphatase MutT (NUDIX family)